MHDITVPLAYDIYNYALKKRVPLTYELPCVLVTVEEIFEALKKNGFVHLRSEWINTDLNPEGDKEVGACVLGQAALNLNLANTSDAITLNPTDYNNDIYMMAGKYSLEVQLDRWKYRAKKWRISDDDGVGFYSLASTIIHWNDAVVDPDGSGSRYVLPTYADVVNMAYDVLKPHFKRECLIAKHDYDLKRG